MALAKIIDYTKNVAKSVSYTAVDILKEDMPTLAAYIDQDSNREISRTIYAGVKDYKSVINKAKTAIKKMPIYETANTALKSAAEDLRSGKYYNQDRIDAMEDVAITSMFGSFDDMDIGDFSFDEDDKSEITAGDKLLAANTQVSAMKAASIVSETHIKTAEAQIKAQKASTQIMYTQGAETLAAINKGTFVQSQIQGTIVNLADIEKTAAGNSKVFYETTTKIFQENNAILKEMLEMQRALYAGNKEEIEKKHKRDSEKIHFDDMVGANGELDIASYFKNIKQNTKKVISEKSGGIFDMLAGVDKDMLKSMAANPIGQFILPMVVRQFIPNNARKAAKGLDSTLSGVASTMMARFNKMGKNEENPISQIFGKIFGVDTRTKTTLDTSKYTKGPVPLDGLMRKSLVEVIPTYLARIESAITGYNPLLFDFKSGKWKNARAINAEYRRMKLAAKSAGTSQLVDQLSKILKGKDAPKFSSKTESDNFNKAVEAVMDNIYENDGYFKYDKDDVYNLGIDPDMYKLIASLITNVEGNKNKNLINKGMRKARVDLAGNVMSAKGQLNRTFNTMEEKGDSVFMQLFNAAFDRKDLKTPKYEEKPTPLGGALDLRNQLDKLGHNVFYYLQNLLISIDDIRRTGFGGGGAGTNTPFAGGSGNRFVGSMNRLHIEDVHKKTEREKYTDHERSQEERYNRLIAEHTKKGGKLFDITDSRGNINMAKATVEQQALLERLEDQSYSGSAIYNALYDKHSPLDEINKKRSEGGEKKIEGKFFDRMKATKKLSEKVAVLQDSIKTLTKKPGEVAEKVLHKADAAIYGFLFNDETGEKDGHKTIKGFMNLVVNKVNMTWDKLNTWLDDKLFSPIKKKLGIESTKDILDKLGVTKIWDSIKDKLLGEEVDGKRQGGILTDIRDEIKNTFGKAKDYVANSLKEVFSPIGNKIKGALSNKGKFKKQSYDKEGNAIGDEEDVENTESIPSNLLSSYMRYKFVDPDKAIEGIKRILANALVADGKKSLSDKVMACTNEQMAKTVEGDIRFSYNSGMTPITSSIKSIFRAATTLVMCYKTKDQKEKNKAPNRDIPEGLKVPTPEEAALRTRFEVSQSPPSLIGNNTAREAYIQKELSYRNKDKYTEVDWLREVNSVMAEAYKMFGPSTSDETNNGNDKLDVLKGPVERLCKKLGISPKSDDAGKIKEILYNMLEANENYDVHNPGRLLNSVGMNELYEAIEAAQLNKPAEKIREVMKSKYNDRDVSINTFAGGSGASEVLGITSSGMGSPIMDKVAETLDKILVRFESIIYRDAVVVRSAETLDRQQIPDILLPGSHRLTHARESETEGDSTDEPPDGTIAHAAFGAKFGKNTTSALSKGEIYGKNGLFGKVPDTGVYDIKKDTTIYPTQNDKTVELAGEQSAISKFINKFKMPEMNADAKERNSVVINGETWYEGDDHKYHHYVEKPDGSYDSYTMDPGFMSQMKSVSTGGASMLLQGLGFNGLANSNAVDNIDKASAIVKKYAPKMTANALLGGAIGLLSGNPLLGASIGAVSGYVQKSERAQEVLFGERAKDEEGNATGERQGGIISKDMQDALKKYMPNMGKYGVAGGALGLLSPFGIAGGAVIGSAIGWATTNDKIKEELFGLASDAKSGLISKEARDKIKKALPNMAVGAIGGMLLGPFGLLGNLALGSGIGMLSTTNGFKEAIFGKEKTDENGKTTREGGLVGAIKLNVVNPLKDFANSFKSNAEDFVINDLIAPLKDGMKPILHEMGLLTKGALGLFPKMIDKLFESTFGRPLQDIIRDKIITPASNAVGMATRLAGGVAKKVVSAPFKAVGAVGRSVRSKHIRSGNADNYTAAERNSYREKSKGRGLLSNIPLVGNSIFGSLGFNPTGYRDKYKDIDKTLEGIEDPEQLKSILDDMTQLSKGEGFYKKDSRKAGREFMGSITDKFSSSYATKIQKAMKSGNQERVNMLLRDKDAKSKLAKGKTITNAEIEELVKSSGDTLARIHDNTSKGNVSDDVKSEMFEKLSQSGFKGINSKNVDKIRKYVETEYNSKKAAKPLDTETESAKENRTVISDPIVQNATDNAEKIVEALNAGLNTLIEIERGKLPKNKKGKAIDEARARAMDQAKSRMHKGQLSEASFRAIYPEEAERMDEEEKKREALENGEDAEDQVEDQEDQEEEDDGLVHVNRRPGLIYRAGRKIGNTAKKFGLKASTYIKSGAPKQTAKNLAASAVGMLSNDPTFGINAVNKAENVVSAGAKRVSGIGKKMKVSHLNKIEEARAASEGLGSDGEARQPSVKYEYDSDSNAIRKFIWSSSGYKEDTTADNAKANNKEKENKEGLLSKFTNGMGSIMNKIFGLKKDDTGKKEPSLISKIGKMLLKLGIGATAIAGAGHLSQFMKVKGIPFIKELWDNRLKPFFVDKVGPFIKDHFGAIGEKILGIPTAIKHFGSTARDFIFGQGKFEGKGFPGVLKKGFDWFKTGFVEFGNYVITPAVSWLVKNSGAIMATLLKGIVLPALKGIFHGIKDAIFPSNEETFDPPPDKSDPPVYSSGISGNTENVDIMKVNPTITVSGAPTNNSSGGSSGGSSSSIPDVPSSSSSSSGETSSGESNVVTDGYNAASNIVNSAAADGSSNTEHVKYATQEQVDKAKELQDAYNRASTKEEKDAIVKEANANAAPVGETPYKGKHEVTKLRGLSLRDSSGGVIGTDGQVIYDTPGAFSPLDGVTTPFERVAGYFGRGFLRGKGATVGGAALRVLGKATGKAGKFVSKFGPIATLGNPLGTLASKLYGRAGRIVGKGAELAGNEMAHAPRITIGNLGDLGAKIETSNLGTLVRGLGDNLASHGGGIGALGEKLSGSNFARYGMETQERNLARIANKEASHSLIGLIKHPVRNAKEIAKGTLAGIKENTVGRVKNGISNIKNGVSSVKGIASNGLANFKDAKALVARNADTVVEGAGNVVKEGVEKVGEIAEGLTGNAADEILQEGKNLISQGTKVVENSVTEGVENVVKEGAEKVAKEGVEDTLEAGAKHGLFDSVMGFFKKNVKKFFENSSVVNYIIDAASKYGKSLTKEAVEGIGDTLLSKCKNAIKTGISKAVASISAKISSIIASAGLTTILIAVGDFISGCMHAESTFGFAKKTKEHDGIKIGFFERIIAGLLKVANGIFTLGLVPENLLVDIFMNVIAPLFGVNTDDFKAKQQKSIDIMNEYNATQGTNFTSIEAFNQKDSFFNKVKKVGSDILHGNSRVEASVAKEMTDQIDKTTASSNISAHTVTQSKVTAGIYARGKYGLGRVQQNDPRYSWLPFNKPGDTMHQTVGDSGCGPAAAYNAVNYAYGTGGDFTKAVDLAVNSYKERNGGTDPRFFDDYFDQQGLQSNRLHENSSIRDHLKQGNPVVLMGKDNRNDGSTPYGPYPHYVTARGLDNRGNIIVDDPEEINPSAKFSASRVLNNSSIAIGAKPKYGRSKWGGFGSSEVYYESSNGNYQKLKVKNSQLFDGIPFGEINNMNDWVVVHLTKNHFKKIIRKTDFDSIKSTSEPYAMPFLSSNMYYDANGRIFRLDTPISHIPESVLYNKKNLPQNPDFSVVKAVKLFVTTSSGSTKEKWIPYTELQKISPDAAKKIGVASGFETADTTGVGHSAAEAAALGGALASYDQGDPPLEWTTYTGDYKVKTELGTKNGTLDDGEKYRAQFPILPWMNKPYIDMIQTGDVDTSGLQFAFEDLGLPNISKSKAKSDTYAVLPQQLNLTKAKNMADDWAPYSEKPLADLQKHGMYSYKTLRDVAKSASGLDIGSSENFNDYTVGDVAKTFGLRFEDGKVEEAKTIPGTENLSDSEMGAEYAQEEPPKPGLFDLLGNLVKSFFTYTDKETGEKKNILDVFFGEKGGSSGDSSALGNIAGLSTEQSKVHDLMTKIIGKNSYTQGSQRNQVGATLNGASMGYGDCSSTTQWALREGASVDPGGDTSSQIQSSKGKWVDGPYKFGDDGKPNASKLALGDLMFYGKSGSDHPSNVSHVEMYFGDQQRIGHGGKMGPTVSPYTSKASYQQYLGAKRFIPVGGSIGGIGGKIPVGSIQQNKDAIWAYLRAKGYSETSAAGAMGNIQKECDFMADQEERPGSDKYGVGIIQWSFGRHTSFVNAVPDWKTNLSGQLDFMWGEINSGYKKILPDAINAKTTPEDAATLWHDVYEQSADRRIYGSIQKRLDYARAIYNEYRGRTIQLPSATVVDNGAAAVSASTQVQQPTTTITTDTTPAPVETSAPVEDTTVVSDNPADIAAANVDVVSQSDVSPGSFARGKHGLGKIGLKNPFMFSGKRSKTGLGIVRNGEITSTFNDPTRLSHKGVDIASSKGTPVISPTNGVVYRSESNPTNGNLVVVQSEDGNLYSFSHLDSVSSKVGDKVSVGSILGRVGSTGHSFGNHVHYQITNKDGQFVDPMNPTSSISKAPEPRAIGGSEGNDYTKLINIIIEILNAISGNSSQTARVLTVISDKLGVKLTSADTNINNNAKYNETYNKIQEQLRTLDSSRGGGDLGSSLMGTNTDFLVKTMTTIAQD